MNLKCSINNAKLKERLEKAVIDGRISHAYLFEGPSYIDKCDFARSFVKGVLCPDNLGENCGKCSICEKIDHDNHEDITYISREGLSIKDAAIENIQDKLNVKPLGDRNVVIINDADTMTARAQNRLLKTLEEPPGDSLIILLSENINNLAQTVLSRCVKFRIEGTQQDTGHAKAEKIVEMCLKGKPFHEITDEVRTYLKDKEKIEQLLDSMEQVYRKLITENQKDVPLYKFDDIYESIKAIEEARKHIKQGMSPGNALKKLILEISI